MSADPYEPSDEELIKREFDDYELPAHDKQSINEIRKLVGSNGYKDTSHIEKHQEFLEDMCNRLRLILKSEKNFGEINWELERQIEEIKALYFELEKVRKNKVNKK
ncbi:hypothetical protein KY348_01700 [Candidatus Woesearchaeota archaeon]|nr:hypothetical protein [Candidatus Woesearchaeota archaeon]